MENIEFILKEIVKEINAFEEGGDPSCTCENISNLLWFFRQYYLVPSSNN